MGIVRLIDSITEIEAGVLVSYKPLNVRETKCYITTAF